MWLCNYEDFEGGAMYDPPYQDFDNFHWRADAIKQYFSGMRTIAVWGCAWGYLVKHLTPEFTVVGFDASQYAIDKKVTEHVYLADCTKEEDIPGVKFDLLVTEDLMSSLTDDEIAVALPLLRSTSDTLCHIVTTLRDNDRDGNPLFNWKTEQEWREILDPDSCMNPNGLPFHK